jgi:glycosyltransferase involved in cell wall biosynthesis
MLSIIICTYNRERYIYSVLRSLADNRYPAGSYEVLLVNNCCTDNTEAECRRFAADYPHVRLRYLVEANQGLSHARNRGIREAQGDILVYVDDDATVNPEYLQTITAFFAAHPHAYAAGGPVLPVYETAEPKWMSPFVRALITGYKYLPVAQAVECRRGAFPGGGNAAYRREVFGRLGLFNPELGRKGSSLIGAEEKDIFDKMRTAGMRFYYLPGMTLYHIIPAAKLTPDHFRRLTVSIGVSERKRTLSASKKKYCRRLVSEGVKWAASVVLCAGYALRLTPQKGWMLIRFRWNVSKGLVGVAE